MSRAHPSLVLLLVIAALVFLATSTASAPNWNQVSTPVFPGSEALLRSVAAVSSEEAWAVGTQQTSSGENRTLIVHYVNGQWTAVPSPNAGSCTDGNVAYGGNALNGVCVVSPGDAWAVGNDCYELNTLVLHWDGTAWSRVASPSPLAENILIAASAVSTNDVWAVGYTSEDIGAGTLVEHWDGARWSVVPSPHPGTGGYLSDVVALSASDVWAVGGYYDDTADLWETLTLRWNGSSWRRVLSPSPGTYSNALSGVAAVGPNDVWAVGTWTSGDGVRTLALHWDGHAWSVVPSPGADVATGYGTTNALHSISAVSANDVWAAGMFQNVDTDIHQHRTLLAHWDGSSWTRVASPSPGRSAELAGIAVTPSGGAWSVGIQSEYPIDIYDGHYTLAQPLVLGDEDGIVAVDPEPTDVAVRLGPATPNPSAGSVSFVVELPRSADVALSVYDVRGREIRALLAGPSEAGVRPVTWDGLDATGVRVRPGLYYVRLMLDRRIAATHSVVLLERRP